MNVGYNFFIYIDRKKVAGIMELNPTLKNIIEWGYCILIAIVLALLVRYYLGTPTIVKQPSMYNTLEPGQRLILTRWNRTFHKDYKRGDIVTFEAPSVAVISPFDVDMDKPVAIYKKDPKGFGARFSYYVLELNKVSYIKRVIGLPGDHVKIEDGKVYINGKELDEPYLRDEITTDGKTFKDIVVPEGYLYVVGDNRPHSTDSREFGCVPIERIESKVLIRFWPFSKFGGVK